MEWWWLWLVLVFVLHGVVMSFFVLLEHRHPSATLAWILGLIFVPFFGALAYYLFGRMRFSRKKRKRAQRLEAISPQVTALAHPDAEKADAFALPWWEAEMAELFLLREGDPTQEPMLFSPSTSSPMEVSARYFPYDTPHGLCDALSRLAKRIADAEITDRNSLEILLNGHKTFASIAQAIREAKHHIHLCYYIIRADKTGAWLRDLLAQRAREGVEVRVLYDAIGSYAIPQGFWKPLEEAGGKVAAFLPLRFKYYRGGSQVNFRNHRKVVVVDGEVGFTGGINIGDEYQGLAIGQTAWRDTHLRLEGAAVRDLQLAFAEDWYDTTEEALIKEMYFPTQISRAGRAQVQIIPSGPDQPWESLHLIFFAAIAMATKRIWITTPYFVPNDGILMAMKSAALRGVDVRLLLPHHSDEKLVWYAGRSYYRDLLRAGVRIYEYQGGILHAKTICADGVLSTIGSANMDIRSFQLNFELNALMYSQILAQQMEAAFLDDIAHAEELELIRFLRRPLSQRLIEAGARLLSPLL
jgi:cardiolipin synthase